VYIFHITILTIVFLKNQSTHPHPHPYPHPPTHPHPHPHTHTHTHTHTQLHISWRSFKAFQIFISVLNMMYTTIPYA